MLDQIRRDLQHLLDDLLAEVDKLRRALAALGPGDGSKPAASTRSRRGAPAGPKRERPTTSSSTSSAKLASSDLEE